jgi:hypothetical protein
MTTQSFDLDVWGVVSILLALFVALKEEDTYTNVVQSAFITSLCAYSQMHSAFGKYHGVHADKGVTLAS